MQLTKLLPSFSDEESRIPNPEDVLRRRVASWSTVNQKVIIQTMSSYDTSRNEVVYIDNWRAASQRGIRA